MKEGHRFSPLSPQLPHMSFLCYTVQSVCQWSDLGATGRREASMTLDSRFGALLKRYRQAAGLSQEALAARADLSARAISDLERGINHSPRSDTLQLLMSALSLPQQQQALLRAAAHPVRVSAPEVAQQPSSFHSLPLALPMVGQHLHLSEQVERPMEENGSRLLATQAVLARP